MRMETAPWPTCLRPANHPSNLRSKQEVFAMGQTPPEHRGSKQADRGGLVLRLTISHQDISACSEGKRLTRMEGHP